ncbi:hypothetical protein ACFS7Z_24150 [Pontibacter toksunensis]|uniref:Uncharacterized protein n=1 Tax=Pontibacter toksunensis TaxID=1332631 RepID=A0ABW6C301_9BACT
MEREFVLMFLNIHRIMKKYTAATQEPANRMFPAFLADEVHTSSYRAKAGAAAGMRTGKK